MEIVNHTFTLRAEETIHLPEYKGSAFHGGFGQALHAISPRWSAYFLKPKSETGQVLPAPYVLLPPLEEKTTYAVGECFSLNLTLFGAANQHYAIAQSAVEFLGLQLGLGYRQGKYSIQDITTHKRLPQIDTANSKTQQVKLQLSTRLRLKQHNRLNRQAPDFLQLMARLSGRIKTLEFAYARDDPGAGFTADAKAGTEEVSHLVPEFNPEQIHCVQHQDHTHWDEWERFSGRQKTWMKFGGLLGEVTYRGDLQPFMPLLRLGEWVHIGGKTSFGLGKYRLIEDATE